MSITKLIADIPTVANLTLKIAELNKENGDLKSQVSILTSRLEQANMEIERFKKVPKPPLKIKFDPGYTPDRNMI